MATTTYGTPYVSGTDLVANWPAASLTVANSIDAAGYYVGRGINAQTASYTGVLTDAGKTVTMTNAGATTFTVPANASVAYPTGTRINILNLGAGACTPTAGAGVTISGTITALATNESASVIKTATNTWSYLAAPTPGLSLITTGTMTAAASISFNNCFTSTYDQYQIVIAGMVGSTAIDLGMRLRVAAVDGSGANYAYAWSGGGPATADSARAVSQTKMIIGPNVSTGRTDMTFTVYGPALASATGWTGFMNRDGGNTAYSVVGGHTVTTAYDGFTLLTSTGTVTTPTNGIRVYGYKNI